LSEYEATRERLETRIRPNIHSQAIPQFVYSDADRTSVYGQGTNPMSLCGPVSGQRVIKVTKDPTA